jgi:hypothetical protein
MRCPRCLFAPIPETASFCSECGATLRGSPTSPPAPSPGAVVRIAGGSVLVIDYDDITDHDEARPPLSPRSRRLAAVAGLLLALAAVTAWLGLASLRASPAARTTPVLATPPVSAARTPAVGDTTAAPLERAVRARPAPPRAPALLSVNAEPWGSVLVDGRRVGDTPLVDIAVIPGRHRVRVERNGFQPYERVITLDPGQHLRVSDVRLAVQEP